MPDKLIDGNITIKDDASRGLTIVEKKLVEIAKIGNSATDSIIRLNKALDNIDKANKRTQRVPIVTTSGKNFASQNLTYDELHPARRLTTHNRIVPAAFPMRNNEFGRTGPQSAPTMRSTLRYNGDFSASNYFEHEYNTHLFKTSRRNISLSDRRSPMEVSIAPLSDKKYGLSDFSRMGGMSVSYPSAKSSIRKIENDNLITPQLELNKSIANSIVPIGNRRFGIMDFGKMGGMSVNYPSRSIGNVGVSALDLTGRAQSGSNSIVPTGDRRFGFMDFSKMGGMSISYPSRSFSKRVGVSALDLASRKQTDSKSIVEGQIVDSAKAVKKTTERINKGFLDKLKTGFGEAAQDRAMRSVFGGSFAFGGKLIGAIMEGSKGGPMGVAIRLGAELILEGLAKVAETVQEVIDTMNRIAEERARESVGLRRKMQMSSSMFGVDPTNIKQIDEKIYAMREKEQQMYLHGLPGRDITSASIEWLHLLGTKAGGGVFEDEEEAFKFSKSLAAIAKMNDLSPQEYETVRYQGMQIMSKGYADILDIKPLLNSAPGFVRDLLEQTGMTRKDLLESGRTRGFTADMFKQALLNVGDYYETLADRATSRTTEQQKEAADNIVGRAAIYDEIYNKEKAMSNLAVATAVAEANWMEDIKESWYQMWSDTNDAMDGVEKKVKFEKKITGQILLLVNDIVFWTRITKNLFDMIFNTLRFIAEEIYAVLTFIPTVLTNGIGELFSFVFRQLAKLDPLDTMGFNELADAADPDAKFKLEKRYLDMRANDINQEISRLDPKTDAAHLEETLLRMGIGNKTLVGYKDFATGEMWQPEGSNVFERAKSLAEANAKGANIQEVYKLELPEDFKEEFFWGGGNANKETGRIADESHRLKVLKKYSNLWTDVENGMIKDREAFKDLEGRTRSLSNVFGDVAKSAEDFKWGKALVGSFVNPFKTLVKGMRTETANMSDAGKDRKRTEKQIKEAMENVHSGYLPRIAGDVHDIAKGKGNEKMLDVLKEIAGVTVINKVTQVRPDVVFNYGSYGRNSGREDKNIVSVGDPNIIAAMVEAINSLSGKWDDNFESIANGVPSQVSIA